MSEAQERAVRLKGEIEEACIKHKLNLTIFDGKIGFVDQEERKIVCLWEPKYKMPHQESDSMAKVCESIGAYRRRQWESEVK